LHPPRPRSSCTLRWFAWVAIACIAPARAGDVPTTALSQSIGMDPLLLDYSSLMFQFPQAVAAPDSVPLALGITPQGSSVLGYALDGEYAVGASVQSGRLGFFALSQRVLESPRYSNARSTLLQFGTGVRVGPLRFGAAVRGLRDKEQSEYLRDGGPNYVYGGAAENIHDLVEPAFGVGVVAGRVSVDAVLELGFESYQIGALSVGQDTTAIQLLADTGALPSGAVRFAASLGGWGRLIAAGQYGWAEIDWQGFRFDNRLRVLEYHETREVWLAGSALVFSTRHIDRVAIATTFERRIDPRFSPAGSRDAERSVRDSRSGAASLAIARQLYPTLWGHAAVVLTYFESFDDVTDFDSQGINREVRSQEYFEDRFSWGASYSRREFDAVASVNTSLRLYDPIVALDAHLHF